MTIKIENAITELRFVNVIRNGKRYVKINPDISALLLESISSSSSLGARDFIDFNSGINSMTQTVVVPKETYKRVNEILMLSTKSIKINGKYAKQKKDNLENLFIIFYS